eukprot:scaffold375_cov378-Prasinococcus_capsulatus_cf.AAC.20
MLDAAPPTEIKNFGEQMLHPLARTKHCAPAHGVAPPQGRPDQSPPAPAPPRSSDKQAGSASSLRTASIGAPHRDARALPLHWPAGLPWENRQAPAGSPAPPAQGWGARSAGGAGKGASVFV